MTLPDEKCVAGSTLRCRNNRFVLRHIFLSLEDVVARKRPPPFSYK